MKYYILYIVGIVLSMFGFLAYFGSLVLSLSGALEYPLSTWIVTIVFYGLLPFIGGIALCNLTSRRWRSSETWKIVCHECKNNIALSSIVCPHCGEKAALLEEVINAGDGDSIFKRLWRKTFLKEAPRKSRDDKTGNSGSEN
jgi:hypothetical protein